MSSPLKQIAVISGKGGTGKTSLVASLARLASRQGPVVTADCDVDAANLGLLQGGLDGAHWPHFHGQMVVLDLRFCSGHGACVDTCRFEAIRLTDNKTARVDPFFCCGCGACVLTCPSEALEMHSNQVGTWTVRPTETGYLVHALHGIAQEDTIGLLTRVRETAVEEARQRGIDTILIDGPPGIDAPVLATVDGVDMLVVITEPTPSGEHDLQRVLQIAEPTRQQAVVVINKDDLDLQLSARIERLAADSGVSLIARLPFDPEVPAALARGDLPLGIASMEAPLEQLWAGVKQLLVAAPR